MTDAGVATIASLLTGVAVAAVVALLVRPTPRLAPRVRPYTVSSRAGLGRAPDVVALAHAGAPVSATTLGRLFGPPLAALVSRVGRVVDARSDEHLALRLRQADLLPDVPEHLRVQEYRVRAVGAAALGAVAGAVAMLVLGSSTGLVVLAGGLGALAGGARWRSRVDRAIDARQSRMRIELYTVNQLLAMNVRVGGGVVQAVQRVVQRGHGAVVDELAEALRAHQSGLRAADTFARAAQLTPEPNAARTYKLLAAGAEWGADLADALLALSTDVRDARREAMRRNATKRRAAMLVPIIAVLAPVMLLFIAAPLPSLVFGVR